MSDSISNFFDAWQYSDAEQRHQTIKAAVTNDIQYDDPRTTATITSIQSLSDYVGEFSANAPGWTAKVMKSDVIGGVTRVTVAFGGKGPDGNEMVQLGQYFAEMRDDKVSRLIGFVGTGELSQAN